MWAVCSLCVDKLYWCITHHCHTLKFSGSRGPEDQKWFLLGLMRPRGEGPSKILMVVGTMV